MKHFIRFFVSLLVAMIWYHLGGGMEVAIFFFLALWAILSLNPIKFQNPRLREEYIEKLKRAKERKRELEEARLVEKKRLKDDGMDKEEKMRLDFENLKKKTLY
ncbi:hypothetical protein [Wolinella succinogenes]|uniref:Uncharacterized protein n=1 Tax=Wolinella succinogenes (strain ATCC 29543 / DSM 1740 / CCUG 13145 / JCM 31913 / LMG 7466 / NCTC 11488 / FDC 602W) TaxID=273121 RepID=Q7MRU1_WOLSU|nr:hypothetical protein [Wolinella succinogenes]NLU34305.1 hypothetical protein [Wolinella succinogenes]CAE10142.1 hypothetical protein WS1042 [Wolinella succinogenes]VEG82350.1 Uncharacterised protein [Wolinella succinogenes]HCZ18218.1 hypothetical protein [Helicobacter sp.]